MSKLNPTMKSHSSLFDHERLAGGFGVNASKEENIQLLRRATLANLLWEDVAYMDGMRVADEIKRLIPLCTPNDVLDLAVERQIEGVGFAIFIHLRDGHLAAVEGVGEVDGFVHRL